LSGFAWWFLPPFCRYFAAILPPFCRTTWYTPGISAYLPLNCRLISAYLPLVVVYGLVRAVSDGVSDAVTAQ
tara:strand:+ start:10160 stop:10375 length:216 start_codon:yes stop_codon:yes gene_type:complete